MAEENNNEKSEKIIGILSGKYKDDTIELIVGDSPYSFHTKCNGKDMKNVTKVTIIADASKPLIEAKIEYIVCKPKSD